MINIYCFIDFNYIYFNKGVLTIKCNLIASFYIWIWVKRLLVICNQKKSFLIKNIQINMLKLLVAKVLRKFNDLKCYTSIVWNCSKIISKHENPIKLQWMVVHVLHYFLFKNAETFLSSINKAQRFNSIKSWDAFMLNWSFEWNMFISNIEINQGFLLS